MDSDRRLYQEDERTIREKVIKERLEKARATFDAGDPLGSFLAYVGLSRGEVAPEQLEFLEHAIQEPAANISKAKQPQIALGNLPKENTWLDNSLVSEGDLASGQEVFLGNRA